MSEENVRLVQQAYSAFSRGDIESVLQLLAPDIEWLTPGTAEVPTAGLRHGREEVNEFFRILNETEDVLAFEPKEFIAQGDTVVAIVGYRMRTKATGQTVETDVLHLFHITDGKITRMREFYDTAAAAAAFRGSPAVRGVSGG